MHKPAGRPNVWNDTGPGAPVRIGDGKSRFAAVDYDFFLMPCNERDMRIRTGSVKWEKVLMETGVSPDSRATPSDALRRGSLRPRAG